MDATDPGTKAAICLYKALKARCRVRTEGAKSLENPVFSREKCNPPIVSQKRAATDGKHLGLGYHRKRCRVWQRDFFVANSHQRLVERPDAFDGHHAPG